MKNYETLEQADLREKDHEQEMVTRGYNKYMAQVEDASAKHQVSTTFGGHSIIVRTLPKVAAAFKAFIDLGESKKSGPKKRSAVALKDDDPYELACIVLNTLVNSFSRESVKAISLATTIAHKINEQRTLNMFKKLSPARYRAAKVMVNKGHGDSFKHRAMMNNARRSLFDKHYDPVVHKTELEVGEALLEIAIQVADIADIVNVYQSKGKSQSYVVPTQLAKELIHKKDELFANSVPDKIPMLTKPLPWESTTGGGYLCSDLSGPFVRGTSAEYRAELDNCDMQAVYDAVNLIQETGFRINKRVYDLVKYFYETDGVKTTKIDMIPDSPEPELPPCPVAESEIAAWKAADEKAWYVWNGRCNIAVANHNRRFSKGRATREILNIAELLKDEDSFYYPITIDFRGRSYPVPKFLSVQGNKLAKGLLEYAEPEKLGIRGVYWLKVACANAYGYDKVSFDERVKWVDAHYKEIMQLAEDFTCDEEGIPNINSDSRKLFEEAGSAFEFLAYCFELNDYFKNHLGNPDEYMSHVMVSLDASQSGIQNISALLKDEDGASKVNLIPASKPNDIYQLVANKVNELIEYDMHNEPQHEINVKYDEESERYFTMVKVITKDDGTGVTYTAPGQISGKYFDNEEDAHAAGVNFMQATLARLWQGKVDRTICKKATMTKCYNSTLYGQNNFIKDFLQDQRDESDDMMTDQLGIEDIKDITRLNAIRYISLKIWDAINGVAVGANECMLWFETVAKMIVNEGLFIYWTSPIGLLVQQSTSKYRKKDKKRINLHLRSVDIPMLKKNKDLQRSFNIDKDEVNHDKSIQAFSPNVVHSLDASVLIKTVMLAAKRGINKFTFVHDSFGTSPGHMDILNEEIRNAFVEIYSMPVLENLYQELKEQSGLDLPPPPKTGNLDLTVIKESKYFFA